MEGKIDEEMDVVAAVIRDGRRILITRRKEGSFRGGLWEFPGGAVEEGEMHSDALAREIKEELGVEVEVGEPIYASAHLYDLGPRKRKIDLTFYSCRIKQGEIACIGCSEYRWVLPEELAGFDYVEGDRGLVERLSR